MAFKNIFACSLFLILNLICKAQDIHFSQYWNTTMLVNPASTGDISQTSRFSLLYRDQWHAVTTNPYRTVAFSNDWKLQKGKLALGLFLLNDRVGDAHMNTTQINVSIATKITINKTNFVRFGFIGAYSQQALDLSDLTWNSQYDGKIINPEVISGETDYRKNRYFDLSAGLLWKHLMVNKQECNIGLGAYHLSQPKYSYLSNSETLPVRWNVTADCGFPVGDNSNLTIHPSFLFMKQASLTEYNIGLYAKNKLGLNSKYTGMYKNSFVSYGGYYRVNDAVIAYLKYDYHNMYSLGLSYDFTVSKFRTVTNVRGGFELTLLFYIM